MPQSKIEHQAGLSLTQFTEQYGTESQCEAALEKARWPEGFRCPRCGGAHYGVIHDRRRKRYRCKNCRHQTTLTAGSVFEATKLALTIWFQANYMLSLAKTGLSALAPKRQPGVSYRTSWMIHHKLMHAMQQRNDHYLLGGLVQIDDAYLGCELSGGQAGRGSESKVLFVAAVEFNEKRRPIRMRMSRVSGFTTRAISSWAQNHVAAGTTVITDGLACFAGVTEAGCKHIAKIAGGRKLNELPLFQCLNTILGNAKTGIGGTYHAFLFSKYSNRYLAEIAYRFDRRFNLKTLHQRLPIAAVSCPPCPERLLRSAESSC